MKQFRNVTPLPRDNQHNSNIKKIEDTIDLLGNMAGQETLFFLQAKIKEERFLSAVLDDKISGEISDVHAGNVNGSLFEIDSSCSKSPTGNCWYDKEQKRLSPMGWFHCCEYCNATLSDIRL